MRFLILLTLLTGCATTHYASEVRVQVADERPQVAVVLKVESP